MTPRIFAMAMLFLVAGSTTANLLRTIAWLWGYCRATPIPPDPETGFPGTAPKSAFYIGKVVGKILAQLTLLWVMAYAVTFLHLHGGR